VLRIVNGDDGLALESVRARVVNSDTDASYHHSYSNQPFRPSPSGSGADSLAPGTTAYLRYELDGHPAGVPSRATLNLHAGDGLTGAHATVTVDFDLPTPAIDAAITYHSYDAARGLAIFRIDNGAGGARLHSVVARIIDRSTGDTYHYGYQNLAFHPSPGSGGMSGVLEPGATAYLQFELDGHPTGVPCRATITVYTEAAAHGASSGTVIDFDLPAAATIDVSLTYHSYDPATGWVTFRVVNRAGGATLESARTRVVNRDTGANYYGPGTSDSPFRASPTSNAPVDSVAPGTTAYMRYKLAGNPTEVPCRATIQLFAGEGSTGANSTRTVNFDLPAPASINVSLTYHSYDAATGWVTFRVVNRADGARLESARTQIFDPAGGRNYYGPGTSDSPFRASPTSNAPVDSVAPGTTAYMRYRLAGSPTGVDCRATIQLYSGEGLTGVGSTRTVNFTLP
jgi:hypothetical protein